MDSADMETSQQGNDSNASGNAPDWFNQDDSEEINSDILEAAGEVVRGRDEFKRKLEGFLKKHVRGELPTTKGMLEIQIANYEPDYHLIRNAAMGELSIATQTRQNYGLERQKGLKKVGRLAQSFVKSFAEFLAVYSGIISLMKGAGSVYGEVAYETLSILFIVVVNKTENDSKITSLLNELRSSFPKLDDWTIIYPTLAMKALVTEVYKQIIEFARFASVYFTRFSSVLDNAGLNQAARFWTAIGRPPSKFIDKTAAAVHQKLAEVSSEAMVHLHKRSQSIHVTVQDSNAQIIELKRLNNVLVHAYQRIAADYSRFREEVEAEQENQDTQRLHHFKDSLNLTHPSSSTVVESCESTVRRAFHSSDPRKVRHYRMTLEYLRSLPFFNTWFTAKHSSLLFLGGTTRPDARASQGYTHSWLSPAALHVVSSIRNSGGKVSFYCCHPGVRHDGDHPGVEVVSALVWQILEWYPRVLRKSMVQWQALVRSKAWTELGDEGQEDDEKLMQKNAVRTWFKLLKGVLTAVMEDRKKSENTESIKAIEDEDIETIDSQDIKGTKADVIHLVLDRFDLVRCSRRHFMEELVALVKDDECSVKALVITDTAKWKWEWDIEELENDERVILVQDLDQKTITPADMSKLAHSKSNQF